MSLPRGWKLVTLARRDAKAVRVITRGLHAYNVTKIGRWPFRHMTVFVRNAKGEVKGGLFGMIYWGWLFVNYFWLDENARRRRLGSLCLRAAEAEAERHGCHGIWLDTGSFQAPGFYRKQGFRRFGFLDGQPPGASRYWFFKRLKPKDPSVGKMPKPSGRPPRPRRPAAKTRRA